MKTKFTYHNSREDALRGESPVEHGRFRRVEKAGKFIVEEQLELSDCICDPGDEPSVLCIVHGPHEL